MFEHPYPAMNDDQAEKLYAAWRDSATYAVFEEYCVQNDIDMCHAMYELASRYPHERDTDKQQNTQYKRNKRWTPLYMAREYDTVLRYLQNEITAQELGEHWAIDYRSITSVVSGRFRKAGWKLPYHVNARRDNEGREPSYKISSDQIIDAIRQYRQEHDGNSPKIRRLAELLNVSTSYTFMRIQDLIKDGLIERDEDSNIILL